MDNGGVSISLGMDELRKPGVTTLLASLISAIHGSGRAVVAPTNGVPPTRRRRAIKPPDGAAAWTWEAFEVGLTENHRKFLGIVESRGPIGLVAVAESLALPGKAIGGLVGSLVRKAANRGVTLPFETVPTESGDRVWKWTATPPA